MSSPINLYERAILEFRRAQKNNNFSPLFKNFEFPKNMLEPLQKMANNMDISKQFQKMAKNMDLSKQFQNMGNNLPKQFQKFTKNLTSSFNKLTNAAPAENYNEIVNGFLPQNAKLITPKYPNQAGAIRLSDLDGDLKKELIASYALGNETTTLVLKKQNDRWQKIHEIKEPYYNDINYMGFASLTGDGKKQLLIGRKGENNTNVLHSYNLANGKLSKMFTRNYHKLEVVGPTGINDASVKKHIAFWDRNDTNAFNIDLLHWNGDDLESVKNNKPYYMKKVIPYYGQRIKQTPRNPNNWYHLADSLMNCGMYEDGLTAIKYGLRLKPISPIKDDFLSLKARMEEKIKK